MQLAVALGQQAVEAAQQLERTVAKLALIARCLQLVAFTTGSRAIQVGVSRSGTYCCSWSECTCYAACRMQQAVAVAEQAVETAEQHERTAAEAAQAAAAVGFAAEARASKLGGLVKQMQVGTGKSQSVCLQAWFMECPR